MRLSLKYKILFIFSTIFIITFFGIYFYLNSNLSDHTYRRIKENLFNQINLAQSYFNDFYHDEMNVDQIDGFADRIAGDLGVRVTIVASDGVVWGDSQLTVDQLAEVENHRYRPEIQKAFEDGTGESRRFSTTIQKNMLYVAKILHNNDFQGVIRLSIPLVEIDMLSDKLKEVLSVSLFFALLFAVCVSFLASLFISKPIQAVSETSRKIAAGDFSKKVIVNTDDEIRDLADSFNFMSHEIKKRIEADKINRSRLEAVLLSMTEGVMAVDLNSNIILMNQTLKDFLQITDEVQGKRPIEVVRNIEIQEIVDKSLKSQKKVESHEVSILLPEERIALIHATSLMRDQKAEGVVLVFHDITELRRLENIRKDFVANVSHELRTPVTSIKGYAETLINGALQDEKNALDFLKIIYKDADRLAKLVDDLLDLSKIESGNAQVQQTAISVAPVLDRVLAGLRLRFEEKRIEVVIEFIKDLPDVLADEAALAQVFLNLIENAIKYNHLDGKVTIRAEVLGAFVQFHIEDTGIGIPPDDIDRVFERFYRVDKARSRELGGTGLGLSIVKHIVNLHNGTVSVQSALQVGSTFSFTLPLA